MRYGRQGGVGGHGMVRVRVSWHRDAASSWISLTRPVCGVGVASLTWHGPSSRSWTLRYVRTNHTNRVIINSSSCAPGPSVDHAVISLGPARLRRGTFRVVHGRRHGAVSVVVAFARTAAGLRPAGRESGVGVQMQCMVSLNRANIGGRREQSFDSRC